MTSELPEAQSCISGRYDVLEKLGAGGMATVVRVRDRVTGQVLALKQLRPELPADKRASIEALFAREYHTLARLRHRRIVEVYDYGIAEANPYYTMELLASADLRELAPLPYREACRHLRDIASSLALLHAHRLVHRDVSPRNVRLAADGSAKLIDFGALANFGVSQEVIGTPPCMAPEMLRHMPLDKRTDLYALGAVAYFALTGRHAYPARTLQELSSVWETPPLLPSSFDASIHPALDALVMSLLSSDPTARPPNAAFVIDQLTSIAALEPEEVEHTAESYLQSGRMVGRDDDVRWIRTELTQAKLGKGRAILFDGAPGIGKTRLLHELSLEAQLHGAVSLKADAQESDAPFGVAVALLLGLLRSSPELAARFSNHHRSLLAQLSPLLRERLGTAQPVELSIDPADRRARFLVALRDCFTDAARDRVLFIALDNAQALEDNSAALLTTLAGEAQERRLLLIATQRSGAEVAAPASIQALRKRSSCVRMKSLGSASCAALVHSMFGEAVNSGRLSRWLYESSAGNPQRCMDLVRLLVKRGIAKYAGGTWLLPLEIAEGELPSQLSDLLAARIAGLGANALSIAEMLSVYAHSVSLEDALALATAEGHSGKQAHDALDELLEEEVLQLEAGRFRFLQTELREAVNRRMDEVRRRRLHARAAQQILATSADRFMGRVDAAWHLLAAGEDSRGAALMATSVSRSLAHRLEPHDFEKIVEALLAALTVFDRQGRDPRDIAEVLFPLMSFGFLVDWRVAETHGPRAIAIGLEITGLSRAQSLSHSWGRRSGLAIGLTSAAVGFLARRTAERRFSLRTAIEAFCSMVPPMIASWSMRYDHLGVARLVDQLAPLRLFGPRSVTALMHDYGVAQLRMVQGRVVEARELLAAIEPRFEDRAVKRLVGDTHLRLLKGGVLFCKGIIGPIACDNGELQVAAELEKLDVQLWDMGAAQVRVLHHGLRGEIHEVEEHLDRVEVFAIQGGTTWQADLFWPFLLLQCYLESEDRIGARRCVEQLERRAREVPSLRIFAEVGRAAYLALRGELTAALALFERNADSLENPIGVAWTVRRMWYAEALIAAGQHRRARDLLASTLDILGPDHAYVRREQIQARRLIALAEAGLGNHDEAVGILDALLRAHVELDQPLVLGLLHRTRAELALERNDPVGFQRHAAEMERRFLGTRNPALAVQWERLMSRAALTQPAWSRPSGAPSAQTDHQLLQQLTAARDRYDEALRLILLRSRAKTAHLYWKRRGELQLMASTGRAEPNAEIDALLRQRVAHAENDIHKDDEATQQLTVMERCAQRLHGVGTPSQSPISARIPKNLLPLQESASYATETMMSGYQVFTLRTRRIEAVFGGVILETPLLDDDALDSRFLDALAAALHELSDTG